MKIVKLEHIDKSRIFEVPHCYFENLPKEILGKVEDLKNKKLDSLSTQSIFEVPQDYFESLTQGVLEKTSQKQPFDLQKTEKVNIFEAPQNYFDKLPLHIQQRAFENKKTLKLLPIHSLGLMGLAVAVILFFISIWISKPNISFELDKNTLSQKINEPKNITLKKNLNNDKKKRENKKTKSKMITPKKIVRIDKAPHLPTSLDAMKISSEEVLSTYLEQDALLDEEDLVEILIEEEQAAEAGDILIDLMLDGDLEAEVKEEDIRVLEQILSNK